MAGCRKRRRRSDIRAAAGAGVFAVVFNADGRPIEPRAFPDDARVQILGGKRQVAFICGSSPSPAADADTCGVQTLGGRSWLVGRIRLDARRDLQAKLAGSIGDAEASSASDARLCLHAYAVWGDRFTDHLAGDFCFSLWDNQRNCLVSVRDQLGKRTLFHARTGNTWFVSDSLDWIAGTGATGRDLDDYWIADFLTLGFCREFERTVYRDIRRLAPAHSLTVSDSIVRFRRYWRLDIAEPLHLPKRRDYTERFRELRSRAIADRMPPHRVGITMSGGLDSTTLAACAVATAGDPSRVVAECFDYTELMDTREAHFARLASRHLGIELHIRPFDALDYDPQWRSRAIHTREPTIGILRAHHARTIGRELAARAPVWLEGEGPDNALPLDRDAYLSWLLRRRSWKHLTGALVQYGRVKGRLGWRQTFGRYAAASIKAPVRTLVPGWLDQDFADRLRLEERGRTLGEGGDRSHPWHPTALESFTSAIWQFHFDTHDFDEALSAPVWRHPFLDLRVLEFMLSVPPLPWGWKKQLIREAMRGRLPAPVLAREKTPLPLLPHVAMMRRHGLPELSPTGCLAAYVDARRLPTARSSEADWDRAQSVHALDYWLTAGPMTSQ